MPGSDPVGFLHKTGSPDRNVSELPLFFVSELYCADMQQNSGSSRVQPMVECGIFPNFTLTADKLQTFNQALSAALSP